MRKFELNETINSKQQDNLAERETLVARVRDHVSHTFPIEE